MNYAVNLRNILLVVFASVLLAACAAQTKKAVKGQMQSDIYTGTDTVEYLATGVKDRVFFATNKSTLTTASRDTLRKQAAWMRKKGKSLTFTIEGHADERGTREYNLALGERRANAVRNYLTALGVPASRVSVISYGKERPVVFGSDTQSWAQNRRAVTVVN